MRAATIPILCTVLTAAGCLSAGGGEEASMPQRPIEVVLAEVTPGWMEIPGVVGTYQGELEDGTPCIKVMVREPSEEIERRIPESVEGHPVRIEVTGEIRAFPEENDG